MRNHRGEEDDRASIDRVLGGEAAAFAGIVTRWQGPLVNLAWRFCRDRGRAEDMAQEAFLRAYRNLGQWRRESAFSTWLFALAINVFRSELRRIPPTMLSLDEIAEPGDGRTDHGGIEREDESNAVRRAVLALPEKYRDAILLYYFQENDIAAAARVLDLPEGTVKARLFRGRELLRKKFSRPRAASKPEKLSAQLPKEVQ